MPSFKKILRRAASPKSPTGLRAPRLSPRLSLSPARGRNKDRGGGANDGPTPPSSSGASRAAKSPPPLWDASFASGSRPSPPARTMEDDLSPRKEPELFPAPAEDQEEAVAAGIAAPSPSASRRPMAHHPPSSNLPPLSPASARGRALPSSAPPSVASWGSAAGSRAGGSVGGASSTPGALMVDTAAAEAAAAVPHSMSAAVPYSLSEAPSMPISGQTPRELSRVPTDTSYRAAAVMAEASGQASPLNRAPSEMLLVDPNIVGTSAGPGKAEEAGATVPHSYSAPVPHTYSATHSVSAVPSMPITGPHPSMQTPSISQTPRTAAVLQEAGSHDGMLMVGSTGPIGLDSRIPTDTTFKAVAVMAEASDQASPLNHAPSATLSVDSNAMGMAMGTGGALWVAQAAVPQSSSATVPHSYSGAVPQSHTALVPHSFSASVPYSVSAAPSMPMQTPRTVAVLEEVGSHGKMLMVDDAIAEGAGEAAAAAQAPAPHSFSSALPYSVSAAPSMPIAGSYPSNPNVMQTIGETGHALNVVRGVAAVPVHPPREVPSEEIAGMSSSVSEAPPGTRSQEILYTSGSSRGGSMPSAAGSSGFSGPDQNDYFGSQMDAMNNISNFTSEHYSIDADYVNRKGIAHRLLDAVLGETQTSESMGATTEKLTMDDITGIDTLEEDTTREDDAVTHKSGSVVGSVKSWVSATSRSVRGKGSVRSHYSMDDDYARGSQAYSSHVGGRSYETPQTEDSEITMGKTRTFCSGGGCDDDPSFDYNRAPEDGDDSTMLSGNTNQGYESSTVGGPRSPHGRPGHLGGTIMTQGTGGTGITGMYTQGDYVGHLFSNGGEQTEWDARGGGHGEGFHPNPYEYYPVRQKYGYWSIFISLGQLFLLVVMMGMCGVAPLDVNPSIGPYPDALSEWGGKNPYLVAAKHQYWRGCTATFLSSGVVHLLVNVVVQLESGAFFEREWGSGRFFVLYMSGAMGGMLLSCILDPDNVAVTSTGSTMGLLGAKMSEIMSQSIFEQDARTVAGQRPNPGFEQVGGVICWCAVLSLLALLPYVDFSAHLGGLVAGFVVGFMAFSCNMRSPCISITWFCLGFLLMLLMFVPAVLYLMFKAKTNEEVGDACEFYRASYLEGYDCTCAWLFEY